MGNIGSFPLMGNMKRKESVFCCKTHGGWYDHWWYDPDTDEMIGTPVCPACRKEKEDMERKENAEAVMRQVISTTLAEIGVPEGSCDLRLKNYVASTDAQRQKADMIAKFVKERYPSTLVMYGRTGSGKTHLAVSALAIAIRKSLSENLKGCGFRYVKSSELLRDFKAAMNAKRGGTSENQLMREYQGYTMLVIDEFNRFISGDYNVSILQEILTHRIEHDMKTIVITNGDMKSFIELAGEHTISRLKMCGKSIMFDEPDWRATHRRTNDDG